MEQLIRFYEQYGTYMDGIFLYIRILVMVVIGIVVHNVWDDKVEIEGSKLLTGSVFISLLLYHAGGWMNLKALYFTSLIFGFGTSDLIRKWIKTKVWNKYDFISKKKNTTRTTRKDKDDKENDDDKNTDDTQDVK